MLSSSYTDHLEDLRSRAQVARQLQLNGRINELDEQDNAFHSWYRFVLSYPPHLVRKYVQDFGLEKGSCVLDPFCGTGTTLVEAKLNGYRSIGIEANPMAYFASKVKTDWSVDPNSLLRSALEIADETLGRLSSQGIDDNDTWCGTEDAARLRTLGREQERLLITDSISPLPLHKVLELRDVIRQHRDADYYDHLRLAFANALVFRFSNLKFGPEVGLGRIRHDVPVIAGWLDEVDRVVNDLLGVACQETADARVLQADSRMMESAIESHSVDGVITSPPYPNEKDYTRTTRLESVLLDFISDRMQLRRFKKGLVRSNTRGAYKADRDDEWVANNDEIQSIAERIETRRIELGKTSGFERLYARTTKLYFGGMARHLAGLRTVLRPGAHVAYVVGDQASYLRVMIRTGKILADIGRELGYELERTDLFRKRFSTATKEQLNEEVVVMRWPG